jgi:hypothetical protein
VSDGTEDHASNRYSDPTTDHQCQPSSCPHQDRKRTAQASSPLPVQVPGQVCAPAPVLAQPATELERVPPPQPDAHPQPPAYGHREDTPATPRSHDHRACRPNTTNRMLKRRLPRTNTDTRGPRNRDRLILHRVIRRRQTRAKRDQPARTIKINTRQADNRIGNDQLRTVTAARQIMHRPIGTPVDRLSEPAHLPATP